MSEFSKLAKSETDPTLRAHYRRMAAGPAGIAHLVGSEPPGKARIEAALAVAAAGRKAAEGDKEPRKRKAAEG